MPAWVADIRDKFFGPSDKNEDKKTLQTQIGDFLTTAAQHLKEAQETTSKLSSNMAQAKTMQSQLDKIKKTVGPRVDNRI